ncbi:protein phosphatase 2C domain-containing protein [Acidothermaceae bacterium B102]|nr:protein phosphatase 2C domain-containing protein [Acidothermaceae bacterium B102]
MTALRFAARSDIGLLRDGNEDSVYAGPRLLAVADGMGGAAAGEVASAVAIAALAPLDEDPPGADLLDALTNAAYEANDQLRAMIAHDGALYGMGTTLTAMLIAGTRIGLLHIGDSRAYLLRDGVLTQITHDHTLVQTFVDEGRITREEANSHPQRALILRALKGDDHLDLDLSVRDTLPGDRYLLCSDGLSAVVSDATLLEALLLPDPQESVDRMVDLALRGGGPDNITCIVAEVLDEAADGSDAVVVAGAASEYTPITLPRADTPAARASLMTAPAKATQPVIRSYAAAPANRKQRHPVRLVVILLVVVGVVAGVLLGGRAYLHRQYYVGVHNQQVTIFRGVPDSFAGVDLSSVKTNTGIPVNSLKPFWRDKVQGTITASSLHGAEQVVVELRANQLPPCAAGVAPGTPPSCVAATP